MSQVKLNLQPPPNVDFVTGYPGIPPGPDRPQASVKGAIEVRVPPQGVKAKWVRIELRKVETLPGGGPANTFYDFVGPSPVNLWSTSDEYSLLRSQDFPFSIRIPESTPPTIALDNRAGIGYELVASVCTKGKKGFLRKAKSVVVSSVAPIIIDKHDLHSTWPVYCQKEIRTVSQEEVTLLVERHNQCYGPGDRVAVTAIVKSDSLHTVILRGFEFFLRETIVFRPGVHGAGKKHAPQTKQMNIGESKIMVNSTLYGGTSHTAELACMISPNHTTTSLQAARHIDIDYVLCIKAIMGTGAHLVMELPVVISNWQRHVSFEAINRIGPAPNLSLLPPPGTSAITRVEPIRPAGAAATAASATLPLSRPNVDSAYMRNASSGAFNTLPAGGALTSSHIDEFGTTTSRPTTANTPATAVPIVSTASASNRFQPKNIQPQEQEISRQRSAQVTGSASGSGSGSSAAPAQQQWPTAEDEKLRLFEQARVKVAQVQGPAAAPPPASLRSSPPPQNTSPPRGAPTPASPGPAKTEWLTAEEEKRRFQQAQAAVARTQGVAPQIGTPTHTRDTSDPKPQSSGSGSGSKPSAAAQLYAEAIKARSAGNANNLPSTKPPAPNSYATAEQEKAALKRYHEAKRAVEVTQNNAAAGVATSPPSGSAPIAYESLFPAASAAAPTAPPPPADSPPPFNTAAGPSNIMAHLSEKERLRRKYEEQDAAAARNNASPPPAAYTSPPPPPPSAAPVPPPAGPGPLPNQYANALEEKEALRRKFEARDNAQARAAPNPQTPARANTATVTPTKNEGASVPVRSPSANLPSVRPAPTPPANARVLTAAEEKALLRAKYEARDGGVRKPPVNVAVAPVNGNNNLPNPNGAASASTPTTPPPLLPRPPADYIKATQEEDARLSRINGVVPNLDGYPTSSSSSSKPPSGASALDMKPFTPFQAGFDSSSTAPPLPLSRPNGD